MSPVKSSTITAVLSYSVILLSGVVLGSILERTWTPGLADQFIGAVATIGAAFAGSWFAFLLHDRKEGEKLRLENLASANRCIFLLARYSNQLELIRQQVIDPVRQNPRRALEMEPVLYLDYKDMRIELGAMSFLLQTRFADLLGRLAVEEQRFHSAINIINERSRLHLEEIQPTLDKAGIKLGEVYTGHQIKEAMGDRLFVTLQKCTDQAIVAVDETAISVERTAEETVKAIKELFPNGPTIRFTMLRAAAERE